MTGFAKSHIAKGMGWTMIDPVDMRFFHECTMYVCDRN